MKFQLNEDKFIIQSFYEEKNILFFNIGFIDKDKIIKYENVEYNKVTKEIKFRNVEFLKSDREVIQNKLNIYKEYIVNELIKQ